MPRLIYIIEVIYGNINIFPNVDFHIKKNTMEFSKQFLFQNHSSREWGILKEISLKLADRECLAMCEVFSVIMQKFCFWLSVRNGRASAKLASYAELRIGEHKIVNVYGLF